jgi:hypothetical protein
MYHLFPKISEMIAAPIKLMEEGAPIPYEPYLSSFAVSIVVFAAATYLFQKKRILIVTFKK